MKRISSQQMLKELLVATPEKPIGRGVNKTNLAQLSQYINVVSYEALRLILIGKTKNVSYSTWCGINKYYESKLLK